MFEKYNAKSIWASEYETNDYFIFEKEFTIDEKEKTVLRISCETEYVCFINDEFVSCGQFSGVKNDRYYYETDISEYVQNGKNKLNISAYYQGKSFLSRPSYLPYLCFVIKNGENIFVSDEKTICKKDFRYKNGEIETVSGQIGYTFYFDANKDMKTVKTEVLNNDYVLLAEPVKKCNIGEIKNGEVIAQGFFDEKMNYNTASEKMQNAYMRAAEPPEIFETEDFGPLVLNNGLKVKDISENVYVLFDLGKETAGYFGMEITAEKDTELNISYGEHLADLRVRAYAGGRNFAFGYKCADGRQKFVYYIRRIAGRYMQLNIKNPKNFEIHAFGIKSSEYPFKEKEHYSGDKLLEKIYDVSVDTLKLCMHEHYEDCPWREQSMYMMDSRIQMLCGYYAFENTEPQKSALITFMKSANDNGLLPLTAPADSVECTIPAFELMWISAYRDYLKYTDDRDNIEEMTDFAGKIILLFRNMYDGKGIVTPLESCYWNFYDWAYALDNSPWWEPIYENRGYDAPLMLYYITALQSYVEILEKNGKNTAVLKKEIKEMQMKTNELFWDEERGMYRTYSNVSEHFCELVQSLAICTGTVIDDEKLKEKLKMGECGVEATLSMKLFKYEALIFDKEWVKNDIAEIWGKMLFKGATSFWETEKGGYDFDKGGSQCHGWSALPVYILKKTKE